MRDLIVTKPLTYATRRMQPGDCFTARSDKDARVLIAIGKARSGAATTESEGDDADLRSLRVEYEQIVGKKPYHGWTPEQLLEKIVNAQAGK